LSQKAVEEKILPSISENMSSMEITQYSTRVTPSISMKMKGPTASVRLILREQASELNQRESRLGEGGRLKNRR